MNYNRFLECKLKTIKISQLLHNLNTKKYIDNFFRISDNQNPTIHDEESIAQERRDTVSLWNDLAYGGKIHDYDDLHVTRDFRPVKVIPSDIDNKLIDEPFCDGFYYYFNDDIRPHTTLD